MKLIIVVEVFSSLIYWNLSIDDWFSFFFGIDYVVWKGVEKFIFINIFFVIIWSGVFCYNLESNIIILGNYLCVLYYLWKL